MDLNLDDQGISMEKKSYCMIHTPTNDVLFEKIFHRRS